MLLIYRMDENRGRLFDGGPGGIRTPNQGIMSLFAIQPES
jgi:hypothetical protein